MFVPPFDVAGFAELFKLSEQSNVNRRYVAIDFGKQEITYKVKPPEGGNIPHLPKMNGLQRLRK